MRLQPELARFLKRAADDSLTQDNIKGYGVQLPRLLDGVRQSEDMGPFG